MARDAVNLVLVEKGLNFLVVVVPGDEAIDLRFGKVGKFGVNLSCHEQLSISRGVRQIPFFMSLFAMSMLTVMGVLFAITCKNRNYTKVHLLALAGFYVA